MTGQSADEENRYRQLCLDIKDGDRLFGLESLREASKDLSLQAASTIRLTKALKLVESQLEECKKELDSVHTNSTNGRVRYTFLRGRGSEKRVKASFVQLQSACEKLRSVCSELRLRRLEFASYLLTPELFKLQHETRDQCPARCLPFSNIWVAQGNLSKSGVRESGTFVVEKRYREIDHNDVRFLCNKLAEAHVTSSTGILALIGYRQPPYNDSAPPFRPFFQMIMRLPPKSRPASLAGLIADSDRPSLPRRLEYCLSVAKALANFHANELLHKALSTRSTLLLDGSKDSGGDVQVYLQDLTYIRASSGTTTQLGQCEWHKAIYQHPARQGQYADEAYTTKHDIYSLGVCMLEILLWFPFVVPPDDVAILSEDGEGFQEAQDDSVRICDQFESRILQLGDTNGGVPERYRGIPTKLASRPYATRNVWRSLCDNELRQERSGLSQLVSDCLNDGTNDQITEVIARLEKFQSL